MGDDDMIRRGDALKAVDMWESDWVSTDCAIRALPKVTVIVKPLEWREVRMGDDYWKCRAEISERLGRKYMDMADARQKELLELRRQRNIDAGIIAQLRAHVKELTGGKDG